MKETSLIWISRFQKLVPNGHNSGSQLDSAGWATDLVIDNVYLISGLSGTQHRAQEVSPERTVDPSGANDGMVIVYRLN